MLDVGLTRAPLVTLRKPDVVWVCWLFLTKWDNCFHQMHPLCFLHLWGYYARLYPSLVFSYLPNYSMLIDFPVLDHADIAGLSPRCSWHEMLLLWFTHVLLLVFMSVFLKDIVLGLFSCEAFDLDKREKLTSRMTWALCLLFYVTVVVEIKATFSCATGRMCHWLHSISGFTVWEEVLFEIQFIYWLLAYSYFPISVLTICYFFWSMCL